MGVSMTEVKAAWSLGEEIGSVLTDGVLAYDKIQYERRITQLEGYNRQLNQHLSTLEGYKKEIGNFWNDSEADEARKLIDINIQKIMLASERVEKVITASKGCVEVLDEAKGKAKEQLDDAISKISVFDNL